VRNPPERIREKWENIVGTEAWESKEVQDKIDELKQAMTGTLKWNKRSAELLLEYQEKLEKVNERREKEGKGGFDLVSHLDTISDALKPRGSIYVEEKVRDLEKAMTFLAAQREARRAERRAALEGGSRVTRIKLSLEDIEDWKAALTVRRDTLIARREELKAGREALRALEGSKERGELLLNLKEQIDLLKRLERAENLIVATPSLEGVPETDRREYLNALGILMTLNEEMETRIETLERRVQESPEARAILEGLPR
jgi:hypothetical protein